MKKIAYIGIDCHLNSLSIAVLAEGETEFHDLIRINNQDKLIVKYMNKLSKKFEIKACYEASFSGYSFLRKMVLTSKICQLGVLLSKMYLFI